MGKLSKLVKSVTSPVAKVLDKLIPNEIKPALPYLAAFAPFYMPPGMQFAQSGIFSNPMFTRALMSGGLNLGAQLAQEGSEGDFNPFSVAMASGVGALGADNAGEFFKGMQKGPTGVDRFGTGASAIEVPYSDTGIMASISDAIGTGGEAAAKFIGEAGKVLRPDETKAGLDLATLKAASVPISQGTGDLAEADARRALRDYENEMANQDQLSLIDDDGRRRAIRAAMTAAGHLEEIIVDTLAELGLKDGGVVGMKHGGQLVKRGTGRPGYAGWDPGAGASQATSSSSSSGGGGWSPGVGRNKKGYLTNHPQGGGGTKQKNPKFTTTKPPVYPGNTGINPNLNFGVNIGAGLNPKDLARLFNNYYKLDMADSDTNPDSWNYGYGDTGITSIDVTPEVPTIAEDKGFFQNIRDIKNKTTDQLIESGILDEYKNKGGRIGVAGGGVASVLPKGREADYRGGGVIPVGSRERADDVPARLSKNEFVMTADAVRAAGGGSINKGAKRMYNLMNNLEARV